MPDTDPVVVEHRLNLDLAHKPVIQKKRHMGPENATTATAKVQKLLEAGFIRKCQYPDGISNVVVQSKIISYLYPFAIKYLV